MIEMDPEDDEIEVTVVNGDGGQTPEQPECMK